MGMGSAGRHAESCFGEVSAACRAAKPSWSITHEVPEPHQCPGSDTPPVQECETRAALPLFLLVKSHFGMLIRGKEVSTIGPRWESIQTELLLPESDPMLPHPTHSSRLPWLPFSCLALAQDARMKALQQLMEEKRNALRAPPSRIKKKPLSKRPWGAPPPPPKVPTHSTQQSGSASSPTVVEAQ